MHQTQTKTSRFATTLQSTLRNK